jgi:site-specific DNA-methyltransferase (adenine-specific)
LTIEEICAVPVPALAAEDCLLFLWGTWPKLPQVVLVMAAWGFEHITGFPWVKMTQEGTPGYRTGYWVAGCSEYVLIGRRGKVSPPAVAHYLGLVGPALEHSRKPEDVHALAEQLPGPYLELFARRPRSGWTVIGDRIDDGSETA